MPLTARQLSAYYLKLVEEHARHERVDGWLYRYGGREDGELRQTANAITLAIAAHMAVLQITIGQHARTEHASSRPPVEPYGPPLPPAPGQSGTANFSHLAKSGPGPSPDERADLAQRENDRRSGRGRKNWHLKEHAGKRPAEGPVESPPCPPPNPSTT